MNRIAALLLLIVPFIASARLGESITDCDVRYGGGKPGNSSSEDRIKPLVTGPNTTNVTYIYKGFTVRVGFRNSTAVRLDITRNGMGKMSDGDIEAILDANKGANPWFGMSAERAAGVVGDASSFAKSDREIRGWRRLDDTVAVLYNRSRSMRLVLNEEEREPGKPRKNKDAKPADKPGSTSF